MKKSTYFFTFFILICFVFSSYSPLLANGKSHTLSISLIEEIDGMPIQDLSLELQAKEKGTEEWISLKTWKHAALSKYSYTFNGNYENFDFQYKITALPLGYTTEKQIIPVQQSENIVTVKRDIEKVEELVSKASYDLNIYTLPAAEGAKFYLEEIEKPEDLNQLHPSKPYKPTYDLGSIFASWRKREDMLSVAQPYHDKSFELRGLFQRTEDVNTYPHVSELLSEDSSFLIEDERVHQVQDELYEYSKGRVREQDKVVLTTRDGKTKIQNIPYGKWFRLMRLASDLDASLPLYKSADIQRVSSSATTSTFYKAYKFKSDFIGAKTKHNDFRNYNEASWIVLKGPRFVNPQKTKYVYDVFVKTSNDIDFEESIKAVTLSHYRDILENPSNENLDLDDLYLALNHLKQDATLYQAEIEKLKKMIEDLENKLDNSEERLKIQQIENLLETARQNKDLNSLEKAILAIQGLSNEQEKNRLKEKAEEIRNTITSTSGDTLEDKPSTEQPPSETSPKPAPEKPNPPVADTPVTEQPIKEKPEESPKPLTPTKPKPSEPIEEPIQDKPVVEEPIKEEPVREEPVRENPTRPTTEDIEKAFKEIQKALEEKILKLHTDISNEAALPLSHKQNLLGNLDKIFKELQDLKLHSPITEKELEDLKELSALTYLLEKEFKEALKQKDKEEQEKKLKDLENTIEKLSENQKEILDLLKEKNSMNKENIPDTILTNKEKEELQSMLKQLKDLQDKENQKLKDLKATEALQTEKNLLQKELLKQLKDFFELVDYLPLEDKELLALKEEAKELLGKSLIAIDKAESLEKLTEIAKSFKNDLSKILEKYKKGLNPTENKTNLALMGIVEDLLDYLQDKPKEQSSKKSSSSSSYNSKNNKDKASPTEKTSTSKLDDLKKRLEQLKDKKADGTERDNLPNTLAYREESLFSPLLQSSKTSLSLPQATTKPIIPLLQSGGFSLVALFLMIQMKKKLSLLV